MILDMIMDVSNFPVEQKEAGTSAKELNQEKKRLRTHILSE